MGKFPGSGRNRVWNELADKRVLRAVMADGESLFCKVANASYVLPEATKLQKGLDDCFESQSYLILILTLVRFR